MAVWWSQPLIRITVWVSVNQRVCFCVLPHLLWQRKRAEKISCQRSFCSKPQLRNAKSPTHLQQTSLSVSLHQSFIEMPRTWFGVITNKFWGIFKDILRLLLHKPLLLFPHDEQKSLQNVRCNFQFTQKNLL